MKNFSRWFIRPDISVIIILCMFFSVVPLLAQAPVRIIPQPLSVIQGQGNFTITPNTRIVYDAATPENRQVISYFTDYVKKVYGIGLSSASAETSENNTITLDIKGTVSTLNREGYELIVQPNRVLIRANTGAGLFYGIQTLLQLFPADSASIKAGDEILLPVVEIKDEPRFSWRGMHLDVCRHFFPVEFVKRYIDLLALHKMNVFHWHLTEDQGWRIEIKKYPLLTEAGAWRVDREHQHWNERTAPEPGEKATYGGFYTQDEVRDVIAYAQSRFITIVPEIEMPGHAMAALAAYPQFSCTGGPFYVMPGGYWPITDIYCAGNDSTFAFLQDILSEVIDLFPGPYIHIGGDEANKANWEKCPKCQARIATEILQNEIKLQSYFIKHIQKVIVSKNKKLIGWDESLEGGLAPEATVMSWRGTDGGIFAANEGHDVVMSPTSHCYFDYYQALEDEPPGIGGFVPLEMVYGFEPMPEGLSPDKQKHILGAQGNLWTEYIPTPEHAEYMALPRMCAMAEIGWSSRANRNLDSFLNRLAVHYNRLDALNVHYRQPNINGFAKANIFMKDIKVTMDFPRPEAKIFYTLDGTEPTPQSLLYAKPLRISANTLLKARAFVGERPVSRLKSGEFNKQQPRAATSLKKPAAGLDYKLVAGEFSSVKQLAQAQETATGTLAGLIMPAQRPETNFGVIYDGYIKIPKTGIYTFYLNSDDGSELLVGDSSLILNDGAHGEQEYYGKIALKKGYHPLRVLFFQGGGGLTLKVSIEGPGLAKQAIPASMLFMGE